MPISRLFHTWSIDFIGLLSATAEENKYLIEAVEHMTGWFVARASRAANSVVSVSFTRR